MCVMEAYLLWCAKCIEAAEAQYRGELYDILKVKCMRCGKLVTIREYAVHMEEHYEQEAEAEEVQS